MDKPLLLVSSVTYAMRARELLSRRGFRASVERISRMERTGCGYGVRVDGSAAEAEAVLRENGVTVLGVRRGEAGR